MRMRWPPSAKRARRSRKSLEAGYNEGLLLDVLGRFDEAAQVYEKMVDLTSHANGAYTTEEKNNRGIFLERLGGGLSRAKQDRPGHRHLPEDDRHGRRIGAARLPGPGGHLSRRQAVRQGRRGLAQGRRRRPQESRPEADAGRRTGGPGQGRRGPGPGQGAAGQHRGGPHGLAGAGPDGHSPAPLERCRRRLQQGRRADHQEGRPHLPALSARRAGRAAEALSSRPSSSSARRWRWTPPTP